jgi:hypothetical protein
MGTDAAITVPPPASRASGHAHPGGEMSTEYENATPGTSLGMYTSGSPRCPHCKVTIANVAQVTTVPSPSAKATRSRLLLEITTGGYCYAAGNGTYARVPRTADTVDSCRTIP